MTAKEIIRKKHGTKGLEPMWLTLDIKQIIWLMKEYHKQQLKILNIHNVSKRNWFEKLSLHWRLLYYFIGGIIVGLLLPYVW